METELFYKSIGNLFLGVTFFPKYIGFAFICAYNTDKNLFSITLNIASITVYLGYIFD